MTPSFYEELDAEFDQFQEHVLISMHRFEEAWSTWERHPKGDELVHLLSGDVDIVLWSEEGERVIRLDRGGSYVVVPRATWHTARPRAPTEELFVTPGEDTQNTETPSL